MTGSVRRIKTQIKPRHRVYMHAGGESTVIFINRNLTQERGAYNASSVFLISARRAVSPWRNTRNHFLLLARHGASGAPGDLRASHRKHALPFYCFHGGASRGIMQSRPWASSETTTTRAPSVVPLTPKDTGERPCQKATSSAPKDR